MVQTLSLVGPGGVGKSELACSFANQFQQRFSLIWWIDSETPSTALLGYRDLAKALKIYLAEQADLNAITKAVFFHLENMPAEKPWLLVLDNVEERVAYPQRGGFVLSTTRSKAVAFSDSIDVTPFTAEEARALLLKHDKARLSDARTLGILIEKLECYPLALGKALDYMIEEDLTVEQYIRELDQPSTLLNYRGSERYPRSLAQAWTLSMQRLSQKSAAATLCLNLCAYLNPADIPESWIENWLAAATKLTGHRLRTEAREVVKLLKSYGGLTHHSQTMSFSMHHLMQQVILESQKSPLGMYKKIFRFLLKEGARFDAYDPETWIGAKLWLPHAEWIQAHPLFAELTGQERARLRQQVSSVHFAVGNYDKALQSNKEALKEWRAFYTSCARRNERLGDRVGTVLEGLGISDEERNLAVGVLQTSVRSPEEHADIAMSLNSMGWIYREMGEHREALSCHQQALAIQEKVLAELHPDRARTFNHLGIIWVDLKNFERGKDFYEQALAMFDKTLGREHYRVAMCLQNIGTVWHSLGERQKARECIEQALATYQKVFGRTHSHVAMCLQNLGVFMREAGDLQSARDYAMQAVVMSETTLGKEHPRLASCLLNLGMIWKELGELQQARDCFEKVVAIREKTPGQDSSLALNLSHLADILNNLNEHSKAIVCASRAVDMCKKNEKVAPGIMASCLNALASAYHASRQYPEALDYYQQTLTIVEKLEAAVTTAVSWHNVGATLSDLGNHQQAVIHYQRALEIYLTLPNSDLELRAKTLYHLGQSLAQLGEKARAKEIFTQTLTQCAGELGSHHLYIVQAKRGLAELNKRCEVM